ncbi:MAG: DUF1214 domain-containing protein [Anaerolineae bacterium]|nr:DUF1214 domain-containing protein [Anaerolineae bacterium]
MTDKANNSRKEIVTQTEEEFQSLVPISGTVDTFFGGFELDHSFPTHEAAERIYDLMDHQRAAQLYLWGIPLVGMTRWHLGNAQTYTGYDYNTLLYVKTFNERRGILTANETTDYFWGFSNTRDGAVMLEMPAGLTVGMVEDMWQQGVTDLGIFGPNAGSGGVHVIIGPNTPAELIPEPGNNQRVHRIDTDQLMYVMRMLGTPEEVKKLSHQVRIYNYGQEPTIKIITGEDKFMACYQPRGLAYWEMLHEGINREVVQERDRLFMYWLRVLGIEKGKPFNPTERQRRILEDGTKVGELMAKTLVYNERLEGVLRQNNWRMILGGDWGDGIKYTQRTRYYDIFDPRARYCYEAITTSPAMTVPMPGKAQAYIGKFEDEDGVRLHGGENYVIHINGPVPAELFWSVVIYDTDTRCIIDNRHGAAGGKATMGSKTPGLRENEDGSYYMLLGPDAPPKGWEANHVQTIPGRGWFPYMRAYGARAEFFNDKYKFPTVNKVKDFEDVIG